MASLTKKLIIATAFLIGLAIASCFFPVIPALRNLCSWVGALGPMGIFLVALLLGIGSLIFLPASPFIIAGSAVFGFPLGLVGALTGIALGAAGGFCLSRWFLRKEISAHFRKHATFRAIDMAIEKEGWKIVILLRLCPIPFGLANYLYGLTG
ncbi:MAG TPA: VTT domain-containing protein, partial [Chthoniobacterales bacterium]|nr:VTT domain-containing protein [Chthoniobacterales bacterium]